MELALRPGMHIASHLRLVRRLGSGAMASVWLAVDERVGSRVAVKFLSAELALDDDVAERFEREAKAVARIACDHVVRVFDHGRVDDDIPYIVMELLDGEDLAERITREGALSLEETAQIVAQVAWALDSAHTLGIVHRDLKPGNIFIGGSDEDPHYKVLDFGIAKDPDGAGEDRITITKTGHAMGTPGFMSPEQWLNAKGVTPKSDLWALGAVAYCALTGEIPFDAESPAKAMFATCSGTLPPASGFVPDLPREIDAWFDKAMSRRPEDRFDNALQMADAFTAIVIAERGRMSLSDRPTMMMPERIHADETPSVPPVALSVPPSRPLDRTAPPADALESPGRLRWRKRARAVAHAVMAAMTVTAAVATVGAAAIHERETRGAAAPKLVRTDRGSLRITGTLGCKETSSSCVRP